MFTVLKESIHEPHAALRQWKRRTAEDETTRFTMSLVVINNPTTVTAQLGKSNTLENK